ncbi:hypothetical protein QE152_g11027 [Popillia japonica]|uniref:Uncharacterized protein n=1 Tax=Popillia japonica TaxID=7064 RepID=A0AAW1LTB1_POPJA
MTRHKVRRKNSPNPTIDGLLAASSFTRVSQAKFGSGLNGRKVVFAEKRAPVWDTLVVNDKPEIARSHGYLTAVSRLNTNQNALMNMIDAAVQAFEQATSTFDPPCHEN